VRSRNLIGLAVASWLVAGALVGARAASDRATAEEVVQKVRAAAAVLAREGERGLAEFRGKTSPFVWKDTYVFVSNCNTGVLLAHPFQPERQGQLIAAGPSYGGVTAADRANGQCTAARQPGGGWYEYPFPKPGETVPARKITYLMSVDGQPYIVGAGIYDDTTTLDELRKIGQATK